MCELKLLVIHNYEYSIYCKLVSKILQTVKNIMFHKLYNIQSSMYNRYPSIFGDVRGMRP